MNGGRGDGLGVGGNDGRIEGVSTVRVTADPVVGGPARVRVTPARVLRSEWHKFRTLRSTWVTLSAASVLILATGLVMAVGHKPGGGSSEGIGDPVVLTLIGIQFGQIVLTVLGVLFSAGEYSTGMIRASLTAVPRRLPVLWAKAAVYAAVTLVVGTVTVFTTFLLAQLFLSDTDMGASLTDPGIARAVAGTAVALTLLGVLGLGLGALLRSREPSARSSREWSSCRRCCRGCRPMPCGVPSRTSRPAPPNRSGRSDRPTGGCRTGWPPCSPCACGRRPPWERRDGGLDAAMYDDGERAARLPG